ncbi:hypothetical protein WICPIJ_002120 [Wickerhamomyces pijperi]|uniref:Secreted protein n=1 Tax=Wickerhamomyces pijperi TaxID=599730 RepID=A0A9P8QCH5_WICPI|nr:hypothetical protein WICPIJ_002120 [Wickerhamomyces pijperi]
MIQLRYKPKLLTRFVHFLSLALLALLKSPTTLAAEENIATTTTFFDIREPIQHRIHPNDSQYGSSMDISANFFMSDDLIKDLDLYNFEQLKQKNSEIYDPYELSFFQDEDEEKEDLLLDILHGESDEFRLAYTGMTPDQVKIFKPVFETLFNGSWIHNDEGESIIQKGAGLRDVFYKLDDLFPQVYLQCIKSKFALYSHRMESQRGLIELFESSKYNKDHIMYPDTKTIASYDWSPRFPHNCKIDILKVPQRKLNKLTNVRHIFYYNPTNGNEGSLLKQCTAFGYVMEFRYNKQSKRLQFGFRIFMSYADNNNQSQCWNQFYKPLNEDELHWNDIYLSCKHLMIQTFVEGREA